MSYETLFSPFKVRGLELKNRVIMPGMDTKMAHDDISEQIIAYHVARARGGCGLNVFEATAVHPTTHSSLYMGLYTEHHRDELKKLTSAVHEAGGKIGIQLFHAGFVCGHFLPQGVKTLTPDNMSETEIEEITEAFGKAARYAVEAGFDMIEFHCAHTYLPHEFLSAAINKRTGSYNGDLEARARFAIGCIRAMRKNMPESMPLFMRLDAQDDFLKGGLTIEDNIRFIGMAAEAGVDAADISRGNVLTFAAVYEVPPINIEPGFNIDLIAKIKHSIDIPVVTVGRINDPEIAENALAEGKADLVAIGRAQIADPDWCAKAQRGEAERIIKCIACLQGCYDSLLDEKQPCITCLRNPMVSREHENIEPAAIPKRVMVIGGGMGGMKAAVALKKRGHLPTLFEVGDKLGGQFVLAGQAPGKREIAEAVLWEAEETARAGVDIRFGTSVTPELIEKEHPDEVIIAVGSEPIIPDIPGVSLPFVCNANEVLGGRVTPTGNVVIIGGGSVGVEVAEYLADRGAKCTVVEMRKKLGNGLGSLRKMFIMPDFTKWHIDSLALTTSNEIRQGAVICTKDEEEITLSCDSVVIAVGSKSRNTSELQNKCTELGIPSHIIGDAAEARDALCATTEGLMAALAI